MTAYPTFFVDIVFYYHYFFLKKGLNIDENASVDLVCIWYTICTSVYFMKSKLKNKKK